VIRGVGRTVAATLVATLALLALAALPAQASPGAKFGIQDDAWILYGPGTLDQRLATLQGLGAGVVRFTLRWDAVAPTKPATPRDPADPAYAWGRYGQVLDALQARGLTALVTLYGAPRWSNGGLGPNHLPTAGDFGDFAYAASRRFPAVRMWTIWNEPNTAIFSTPVSPSLYVTRLLNPGYAALHQASARNLVAGGVTSPRKTPTGMAPLAFMQGMHAAHARLDAYAQNPYPLSPSETPARTSCESCSYFTMATLPEIRRDVTRYFGAKQLWLTEYGYQTNPPDPLLGVSYAKQAQYIGEAGLRVWRQPGVTVLIQFLVRDEPALGGWQSGLYTAGGAAKPSVHAFPLPLAQVSRHGSRVALWGMVRPGRGARSYVVQVKAGAGWRTLASGRTAGNGAFARTVTAARGASIRLFAPALGYAGPTLRL
jgi:hypothetical protein